MKIKLLTTLLLLSSLISFSQTEKVLKGKVVFEDFPLPNVEIINSNSKKMTTIDSDGNFCIEVRANNLLFFVSKLYEIKQVLIEKATFEKELINISLTKKPIELEEVLITKLPTIKLSKDQNWEQAKIDQYAVEKKLNSLKTFDVNTGTIENGTDLKRIGVMIIGLFVKEKEKKNKIFPEIKFSELAKNRIDQKFFLDNLKLNPDEINLFLQFCEADAKYKALTKDSNILSLMDFLFNENLEFKKL